jgi:hypothetical protein
MNAATDITTGPGTAETEKGLEPRKDYVEIVRADGSPAGRYSGTSEGMNLLRGLLEVEGARRSAVPWEPLKAALTTIRDGLRHVHTDSAVCLARFVWSLWNGEHVINLYRLNCVLDGDNSEAVAIVFSAWLLGGVSEDHLRWVLTTAGEFQRWEKAKGRNYPKAPDGWGRRARG